MIDYQARWRESDRCYLQECKAHRKTSERLHAVEKERDQARAELASRLYACPKHAAEGFNDIGDGTPVCPVCCFEAEKEAHQVSVDSENRARAELAEAVRERDEARKYVSWCSRCNVAAPPASIDSAHSPAAPAPKPHEAVDLYDGRPGKGRESRDRPRAIQRAFDLGLKPAMRRCLFGEPPTPPPERAS